MKHQDLFDEKDYALNDLDPSELSDPPQKTILGKIFLFLVLVFLLFLMFSYLLPYNFPSLIPSQLGSNQIENNILELNTGETIIFESEVYHTLLDHYLANQEHEVKVCLQGNHEHNHYEITSLYFPQVYYQDFSQVRSAPCSADTLISLHSHPYKSCYFSQVDVESYQISLETNPDLLIAVMCEENKFMVLTPGQLLDELGDKVERSSDHHHTVVAG